MSNHNQSFRDVFVSNNPALYTSGDSTGLAIGQMGIFNYNPDQDRLAIATPDFRVNKTIQLIIGTPPVPTNLLGAVADQSKVSKPIKGKKLLRWTGRPAQRGQTQILTIGFDGFDDTKTLTALCEQSKDVFVKLSGGPIDQAFHTEGRGLVRQYSIFSGCCDDCGDDCANVAAERMADDLVNQINTDPILSLGTRTNNPYGENLAAQFNSNQLIKAKKIVGTAAPSPSATGIQYLLTVCDNGDDVSLGAVQAQYPGVKIIRIGRVGSNSTYQQVLPSTSSAPTAFNDSGLPIISDCPTCPSGYTLVASAYVTLVQRQDTGDSTALTNVKSAYSITGTETASRIKYQFGQSTYILTTTAPITAPAVGTDFITSLGQTRNSCVITTPITIAWTVGQTWNAFDATFTITLEDNVCGNSRLAELQAYYPTLVITDNGAGVGTACVHNFSTVVQSDFAPPGCPADAVHWFPPDPFNGIKWHFTPAAETNTVVGVQIEGAYVDLVTNECAYMFWRYDAEPIFIEVSQHDQDYNAKPTICAGDWPVTQIQEIKIPSGVGSQVRDQEIYFKGYERKYWDINPIVRQYQDSIVQADPEKMYDNYTLEFDFSYHEFYFSEKMTDSYRVEVYFPEGTGKQFQEAINAWVTSIGIDLEPVEIV